VLLRVVTIGPILASGSNVYVVWSEAIPLLEGGQNPSTVDILYTRSTNGGASFGSTVNLTNSTPLSFFPAVAASGNNVYVVWVDSSVGNFNIFYTRSTNGGASFGSTVNLSNTIGQTSNPAVAVSNNLT
jgi:hypothetical protein